MKRYFGIFIVFLAAIFLFGQASFAEKAPPAMSLSKEELAERIKYFLEFTPEAADFIPELKITRDENRGIVKVEYNVGGVFSVFKDIEELDKETLVKIHSRVNNERIRIQTERIQRQLEAVRAPQMVPRPPAPPPAPPKVPAPPPAPPRQPRR